MTNKNYISTKSLTGVSRKFLLYRFFVFKEMMEHTHNILKSFSKEIGKRSIVYPLVVWLVGSLLRLLVTLGSLFLLGSLGFVTAITGQAISFCYNKNFKKFWLKAFPAKVKSLSFNLILGNALCAPIAGGFLFSIAGNFIFKNRISKTIY